MSRRYISATIVLGVLLASGCTSTYRAYPPSWAPLLPPGNERCGEVAGTYLNLGTTYPSPMNAEDGPRLAYLLLKKRLLQNDAVSIALTCPAPGELRITGYRDSEVVYEKTLFSKEGDFVCSPSGIERAVTSKEITLLASSATRTKFLLSKTEKGDLAVRQVDMTGAICFCLFPWGFRETNWYLFPAVRAEP